MSFGFVSWEANLDLIDCCPSDVGRTDLILCFSSMSPDGVCNSKLKKNSQAGECFNKTHVLILKMFSKTRVSHL